MEVAIDILTALGLILLWAGLILASRILTTFIHEMGHAIPALIWTNGPVGIHIGSHNMPTKPGIRIGRWYGFMEFNLFRLDIGLCMHQKAEKTWQQWAIVLGGPIASLCLALGLLLFILLGNLSDNFIIVLSIFIFSALLDFVVNITPSSNPIVVDGKRKVYNDGYRLQRLSRGWWFDPLYLKAIQAEEEGDLEKAVEAYEAIPKKGRNKIKIYRSLIEGLTELGRSEEALKYLKELEAIHKFKAIDHYLAAKIHLQNNDFEAALTQLNRSIYLEFQHPLYLESRANLHVEMGSYELAKKDFDRAIFVSTDNGALFRERARALLRLNELEAAWADIETAERLGPEHPNLVLYKGLWYEAKEEAELALQHLRNAKALGTQWHGLDFKIESLEGRLELAEQKKNYPPSN